MVRRRVPLDATKTGGEAQVLESGMRRWVVGQDEAIRQIVDVYQVYVAGLASPGRPVGNFLFLGPTGSGKTRTVEATAQCLLGDPRAMIKVDCAELQHSHEIAKLVGSPPGYLGHRETRPMLSQEALDQFRTEKVDLSIVLFDEIEKASDALWNLLLGILDKATLTLGDGRRVDFSRTMIFLTSNLGAQRMASLTQCGLGFTPITSQTDTLPAKIDEAGMDAARRKFTPEFMNRIDKVVVFRPLGEAELRKVLDLELNLVQERILGTGKTCPFVFSVSAGARRFILDAGTDPRYGARHLKRAIDRTLVQPMANLLATEQIRNGDLVRVELDSERGSLVFFREAEGIPGYSLSEAARSGVAPIAAAA